MALHILWKNCFRGDNNIDAPNDRKAVYAEDLSSTQDDTDISSVVFNVNDLQQKSKCSGQSFALQETLSLPIVPFASIRRDLNETELVNHVTNRRGIPLVVSCTNSLPAVGSELLDPTDPLVFGKLDEMSGALAEASYRLFRGIQQHLAGQDVDNHLVALMQASPETCQVRYPFRGNNLYPLTIFSATGCILGAKAAYEAFSEAIGIEDSSEGFPLHVAATNDQAGVAEFLKNVFPEALSKPNRHHGQTPLHLACRYGSKETIQTVITPAALQSMDKWGFYPVHQLCDNPTADPQSFDILVNASALVANSVTMELRNPLHIAAKSGNVGILERVHAIAPQSVRETDDNLQVPLHVAASENQRQSVESLIRILLTAIHAIDLNGNRPRDLTSDPWIKSLCSRYHRELKNNQEEELTD